MGSLRRTVLERPHRPKTSTAAVGMRVDSQQLMARCWVWALMVGLSLVTGLGDAFQERVYPLLQTHCFRCHGEKRKKGGVDLAHFKEAKSVYRDPKLWEKVLSQLNDRSMPPDEEPTPSAEEVEVITRWIDGALENPPADLVPLDPGSKPVHRLGRIEYNNTLRDLLGVTNRPADRFPSDGGGGGGFENNAETLFLPPLLLERYLATATEAISQAAPEWLYRTRPVWYSSQRLAARDNLRWFARRAFRRPVQESEVQRLVALYDRTRSSGVPYESALKTAYKAILVSPHFLFRVEIDPPGKAPARISDHELAVRLSYFLWSSMPDEALFRVAEQGQLGNPDVLEREVRRMLRDPKASALAESFAGQWFGIRNLTTGPQPDRQKHPDYTESLRDALAAEPVAFFNYLVQFDRPLTELIDADYAFVNSELAKHYGLTNPPKGTTLSRVILPVEARQQGRGGLVGMGAVLVQTSYPRRSSPVLRGKWLLEEVLGTPPPPPPPLVKTLSQDDKPRDGLSFRQQLEEHRKNPSCAGCHQRMDPLGFALENFDATGRWRRDIGGEVIDSKGTLVSGETVDGPVDLKRALMARRALFLRHITEKMLAYALGRGLEFYDMPVVKHISDSLVRGDARATQLILDVAKSYPFQHRRGADALTANSPSGH